MPVISFMHRVILFLLVVLVISENVFAGSATVSWNANTESDLAGYKIYYGTSPRGTATRPAGYAQIITLPLANLSNPSAPSHIISTLADNTTYYFAVTSYDTAGNESNYSTEVSKTTTVAGVINVRFIPRLDGGLSISGRTFTVSLLNPGSNIIAGEFTAQPDGTGNLVMPGTLAIPAGTYDILVASQYYLRRRQANAALASNASVTLPILLGGNLNDPADTTINEVDWSLMSPAWGSSSYPADINRDNVVNEIDFSIMNKNWGLTGNT